MRRGSGAIREETQAANAASPEGEAQHTGWREMSFENIKPRDPSTLREIALDWIKKLPSGRKFSPSDIYRYLETEHPDKVRAQPIKGQEPGHKNDARWAIRDAKDAGLIVSAQRDEWERTQDVEALVL
jgi:hypothetical protein